MIRGEAWRTARRSERIVAWCGVGLWVGVAGVVRHVASGVAWSELKWYRHVVQTRGTYKWYMWYRHMVQACGTCGTDTWYRNVVHVVQAWGTGMWYMW